MQVLAPVHSILCGASRSQQPTVQHFLLRGALAACSPSMCSVQSTNAISLDIQSYTRTNI